MQNELQIKTMSDHEFSMVPYRFSTQTMDNNIYATANETDQNN